MDLVCERTSRITICIESSGASMNNVRSLEELFASGLISSAGSILRLCNNVIHRYRCQVVFELRCLEGKDMIGPGCFEVFAVPKCFVKGFGESSAGQAQGSEVHGLAHKRGAVGA